MMTTMTALSATSLFFDVIRAPNRTKYRYREKVKNYTVTVESLLYGERQKTVLQSCGCYSHLMPFNCSMAQLCYNVPDPQNKTLVESAVRRVACHDETLPHISRKHFHTLRNQRRCHQDRYTRQVNTVPWPNLKDMRDFLKDYVVPVLKDSVVGGQKRNHFLKQKVTILDSIARNNSNGTYSSTNSVIRRNFLKVHIYPNSNMATLYKEITSYSLHEAFAEIGGIFGLWIGMSFITIFETFELVIIILKYRLCRRTRYPAQFSENEDENFKLNVTETF